MDEHSLIEMDGGFAVGVPVKTVESRNVAVWRSGKAPLAGWGLVKGGEVSPQANSGEERGLGSRGWVQ